MREREDANRTREAGNQDEVEGVVANKLDLFRNGAVGFIDWLDAQSATSAMSKDRHDCDEQKPRAKQEQTESGATNLSDCDAAFARLNRKCEVQ